MGVAGFFALGADSVLGSSEPGKAAPHTAVPRPRAVIHPSPPSSTVAPNQPAPPPPTPTVPPSPRAASWSPARLTTPKPRKPLRDLQDLVPPPPPKTIALTIDDGPHPLYTPQVLDVLAEHEVRATFFIIGEQVIEYPKLTRRIADAGHQVCNHTMTHPLSLGRLSTKKVRQEIVEAHDRIAQSTGIVPTFFRAPGGNWSKATLDIIGEHGMLPVDWAVDPQDWRRPGVGSIRRGLLKCGSGDILLCHDGGGDRSQTVKALRGAIPKLKKRGLTFVSL
ncbi:polysaccharide deacetylase family protein [Actinomadura rudentiformis]|uniref:Polysaccharide deacetylase family protein n=1 Tax=Actinomadura rudentiformis TaxID=359158 RepID=A0A6H9Z6Z7_9ACTN|nr:polysaccharide deacetylase family protein [Actinomadura rudentiformis]KAB2350960.1 polysaccharide deacetylase family protein [Actinomadura rudentiformis]